MKFDNQSFFITYNPSKWVVWWLIYCSWGMKYTTSLNGKGAWSHSHTPTHAMSKTHVRYVTHLKYCMVRSPFAMIFSFSILVTRCFTVALLKRSVYVQLFLLFFFYIITFGFSSNYYLLNTLRTIVHTENV